MAQKNRIFILFGQSNALGEAPMASLPAAQQGYLHNFRVYEGSSSFDVINHSLNNNQFGQPINTYGYEFELRDLATHYGNDVYLLKFAKGGTSLAQRGGDDWNTASVSELFNNLENHISNAENFMTNRGKDFEWSGIIWHQGEADAKVEVEADAYAANEASLISGINDCIAAHDPFWYIVDLHDDHTFAFKDTVKAAKVTSVALNPTKYRLIDQEDADLQDVTHLSPAGNATVGQILVAQIKIDVD